jgi:hypothetical protein
VEITAHRARLTGVRRLLADDGPLGHSLAAIVLVLAWVLTWRPQVDPDVWWHLLVGEHVLRVGDVPRVDELSWLSAGQPFVAHSWLWDVAVRSAYDIGGLMATSLLALPISAVVVGLLWVLVRDAGPGLPPLARAGLVALAIVAGLPIWTPRAQLWDLALLLACVALWVRWLRDGRLAPLALIPLLTILWANLHGSGVLGFVASLAALAVAYPIGVRWGSWPARPIRPLLLSSLVALFALALNPYGPTIPLYPFDPAVASAFHPAIDEWRSPDFTDIGLLTMRALIVGTLLVVAATPDRLRQPFFLLLAAGWTFAALGSVRFVVIAGPMLVLVLASALAPRRGRADDTEAAAAVGAVAQRAPDDPTGAPPPRVIPWIGAAVVIAVLLIAGAIQVSPARQDREVATRYPVSLVDRLVAGDCSERILNAYDWGGYLAYRTGQPVGAYGNSPGGVVETQAALERLVADPGAFLDANDVAMVLMPTGGPLDRWLDDADGWSVAGRDPQATLHVRDGSGACLS